MEYSSRSIERHQYQHRFFHPARNSLNYLRSLNIKLIFYKLTDELIPDYDYLNKFSFNKHEDAFLLVHFFGRIRGQKKAKEFVNSKGIYLIEDCAHVSGFNIPQKWLGDFIFFSPHKHFSIPKIGILFSKEELKMLNNENIFEYSWYLKRLVKRIIFYRRKLQWGRIYNGEISEFKSLIPSSTLQNKALKLIQRNDNLNQDKLNFIFEKIAKYSGWRPLINFSENDYPYLIPMICESKEIASRRFYLLNKKYQIVMQWPDIPFELKSLKDINKEIYQLVDTVLFFIIPNNQKKIIKVLNSIQNDPLF